MQSGTGETAGRTSVTVKNGSSASRRVTEAHRSVHRHASSAVAGRPIVITPSIHEWFRGSDAASTASAAPSETPDSTTGRTSSCFSVNRVTNAWKSADTSFGWTWSLPDVKEARYWRALTPTTL